MDTADATCSVCLLTYDGETRKPLVLPCSHSFCQECLQQLDALSNRNCPCCRESWQHIAVADLLFCRQLIPVQSSVPTESSKLDVCEEHGVGMSLWCDSCHVQLCIKCHSDKHRECKCLLIKEKINLLKNTILNSLQKMKTLVQPSGEAVSKYTNGLFTVNFLENALSTLKLNLNNYKQEFDTWAGNVNKEVALLETSASTFFGERSVASLEQRLNKIQMPQLPETLSFHVARAYFVTCENTADLSISSFVENVNSLKCEVCTTSTDDDSEGASGRPKTLELKDGQVWTVNSDNAAAAIATFTNTSVRPSFVAVKDLINWQIQDVQKLFKVLTQIKCNVRLHLIDSLTEVSDSSHTKTKEILNLFFKKSRRCCIVDLWGHLDADDVKLLPNTLSQLGLVLSSSRDMQAVNTLLCCSMLKNCEIHITMKQSFQAKDWIMPLEITNILAQSSVNFALHFPNLKPVNVGWMVAIIGKIAVGFKNISCVRSLHLPGTTVSPDAVLGVLRDWGLKCTVYMPCDSAPEHGKEELEARFKRFVCTVVWH